MFFFIKKIWGYIRECLAFCEQELVGTFTSKSLEVGSNLVSGCWLSEDGCLGELIIQERTGLICWPGQDLGPMFGLETGPADTATAKLVVTRLEALVPLIKCLARNKLFAGGIVIFNLSQMSSVVEQQGRLFEPKVLLAHQRALVRVFIELKALGPQLGFPIVIVDQPELLGRKNSALFERLFIKV